MHPLLFVNKKYLQTYKYWLLLVDYYNDSLLPRRRHDMKFIEEYYNMLKHRKIQDIIFATSDTLSVRSTIISLKNNIVFRKAWIDYTNILELVVTLPSMSKYGLFSYTIEDIIVLQKNPQNYVESNDKLYSSDDSMTQEMIDENKNILMFLRDSNLQFIDDGENVINVEKYINLLISIRKYLIHYMIMHNLVIIDFEPYCTDFIHDLNMHKTTHFDNMEKQKK